MEPKDGDMNPWSKGTQSTRSVGIGKYYSAGFCDASRGPRNAEGIFIDPLSDEFCVSDEVFEGAPSLQSIVYLGIAVTDRCMVFLQEWADGIETSQGRSVDGFEIEREFFPKVSLGSSTSPTEYRGCPIGQGRSIRGARERTTNVGQDFLSGTHG